jgi:hypothetical protein
VKHSDLGSVISKLDAAEDAMDAGFSSVEKEWIDAVRREFEEKYLATIEPSVKKMVDAIARLATVLANAEHQCGSDYE